MNRLLVVSSSPHARDELTVRKIMGLVLIALLPAGVAGVYFFGLHAFWVIAVCVASAVGAEALWQRLNGRKVTVSDLSARLPGSSWPTICPRTFPFSWRRRAAPSP